MVEPILLSQHFDRVAPIGLIVKDAGSANLIAHAFSDFCNVLVYCEEPATSIFDVMGYELASSFKEVIEFSNEIVFGTGGTSFEKRHLRRAILAGKKTSSVLDHWVNYELRFEVEGALWLPDELIVFDEYARALANEKFRNLPVVLAQNSYEAKIKQDIENAGESKSSHVRFLYIHENLSQAYKGKEYWLVCFEAFYRQVAKNHERFSIVLRIHPKDSPADFYWFEQTYAGIVVSNSDLASDLAVSDVVVGVRSAALVTAWNCGKRAFSSSLDPDLELPGPVSQLPKFSEGYAV